MRQFFYALLVCIVLTCLTPPSVAAHGSGPPFFVVDGEYAQTNPYYAGAFPTSQDVTSRTYVVNKPIEFHIDTEKLLVPPEIVKGSKFRWQWDEGNSQYEYGLALTHTYDQVGSYLVTLDVQAPGETEYTTIDTTQINVVPKADYQMPKAVIAVKGGQYRSGKPIEFISQVSTDPAAKPVTYYWAFGGASTATTPNTRYTFKDKDFLDYVFLKVTDSNGLVADHAIMVSGQDGKIELSSMSLETTTVPVVKQQFPAGVIIGAVIAVFALFGLILWMRNKR